MVQALRGEPITIYGDGSQTRSFTYVDDEIRGFLALLDSDVTVPVNIGNPDEYTIKQLAEMTLEITGSASRALVRAAAGRRPDAASARHHHGPELLGWEPTIELAGGPGTHCRVLPLGRVIAAGTSPVTRIARRRGTDAMSVEKSGSPRPHRSVSGAPCVQLTLRWPARRSSQPSRTAGSCCFRTSTTPDAARD